MPHKGAYMHKRCIVDLPHKGAYMHKGALLTCCTKVLAWLPNRV